MGRQSTTQTTTPIRSDRLDLALYPSITDKAQFISNRGNEANPYLTVPEYSEDQNAAVRAIRDLMGKYQGDIDLGLSAQRDALARSGRAPTGEELKAYQNPFTEQVLNRTIERLQEQGDKNYKDIGARSALSGAFGGSRQGLLEALNASDTQRNIGDTYYSGMKDNYDQSLSTYLGQLDRLSQNAGRMITGAGAGQAYGLTDASALDASGQAQTAHKQLYLDKQAQAWDQLRNQPLEELQALATAAGALAPGDIGSKTTQTTSSNPLTQLLGLGSTIGSLFTGGASSGIGSLLTGAGKGLGGTAGNGIWGAVKGWSEGGPVSTNPKGVAPSPTDVGSTNANKVAEAITLLFSGGGYVEEPTEILKPGQPDEGHFIPSPKRGYAYGGRVGNPFSMGESSDVIRQTQNPFTATNDIGPTPGGYGADNAMASNVNLSGGVDGPLRDTVQGGMVDPQMAELMNLGGPSSPDMLIKPDIGGNPVAKLLGDYKTGLRTQGPMNFNRNPMDFMGQASIGMAQGGLVKPNGNPIADPNFKGYASGGGVGGSLIDSLFGKQNLSDTLLKLGISMLSNPQANPLEALGTGLGGLVEQREKQGMGNNPLDALKLEYQQLRNQDILSRMEDRTLDNEWNREKFDRSEERMFAAMGSAEERAARAEEGRDRRFEERMAREEEKANRPAKFSSGNYPGLREDQAAFNREIAKPVEDRDEALIDELATRIEDRIPILLDDGYEDQANSVFMTIKPYKERKKKKDQAISQTKNTMDSFYSILGQ